MIMIKNKLTIKEIRYLRGRGHLYGLNASQFYWSASPKQLQEICNGVGPNWMPEWSLKTLSFFFKYFLPSTNPHDEHFHNLPKTIENFHLANDILFENMKRQYETDYEKDSSKAWWNYNRWVAGYRYNRRERWAKWFYDLCENHGESAFMADGDE
jgi:hypothetical protein